MSDEHWRRLRDLFESVREISPPERSARQSRAARDIGPCHLLEILGEGG
jgi:hypothetical protein